MSNFCSCSIHAYRLVAAVMGNDVLLLRMVSNFQCGLHTNIEAQIHLALNRGVPMVLHSIVRPTAEWEA